MRFKKGDIIESNYHQRDELVILLIVDVQQKEEKYIYFYIYSHSYPHVIGKTFQNDLAENNYQLLN